MTATYTLSLTPALVNATTEGSLDTSVSGGKSYQRTGYIEVSGTGTRKIVELTDSATFTDVMQTITTSPGITITA